MINQYRNCKIQVIVLGVHWHNLINRVQWFLFNWFCYAYPVSDGSKDEYHIGYVWNGVLVDLCQGFSNDKDTYSVSHFDPTTKQSINP